METQEGGWRQETLSAVTSSPSVQSDPLCRPAIGLISSMSQYAFIKMDTLAHTPHAIVIGYITQGVKSFLKQHRCLSFTHPRLFHIHIIYFLTWITKRDIYRMSKLVFSIESSKILSEYYISVCLSLKSIIRLVYSDTFLSVLQLTGSSSHLLLLHGRAHFSELLSVLETTWGWINKIMYLFMDKLSIE